MKTENKRGKASIHGACRNGAMTRLYRRWSRIKERCYNPNCDSYCHYGARGISVCDEWRNDFAAFEKWAKENGFREDLQIDREDNDGNYEPSNCRFVSPAVNTQKQPQVKLSRVKASVIKCLLKSTNLTHKEIARLFSVNRALISLINTGKRWKNA